MDARDCAVVEDTITGVQAGIAAGAKVLGYSAAGTDSDHAQGLRQVGASLCFSDMAQLPGLVVALNDDHRF